MSSACEVFVRAQQLSSHFENTHRELIGRRVSVDVLAPLAIPSSPRHLRPPPPLPGFPHHETRTHLFLPAVSMPRIQSGHSQSSVSQRLSRRWSRLNVQDEDSDENPISFDNLPSLQGRTLRVVDIDVRRLPAVTSRRPLLSHPQPSVSPPVCSDEPEQAILYSAFERMVDNLVAAGTLAGHKGVGM